MLWPVERQKAAGAGAAGEGHQHSTLRPKRPPLGTIPAPLGQLCACATRRPDSAAHEACWPTNFPGATGCTPAALHGRHGWRGATNTQLSVTQSSAAAAAGGSSATMAGTWSRYRGPTCLGGAQVSRAAGADAAAGAGRPVPSNMAGSTGSTVACRQSWALRGGRRCACTRTVAARGARSRCLSPGGPVTSCVHGGRVPHTTTDVALTQRPPKGPRWSITILPLDGARWCAVSV